jgi:predicted nucleotidyltransferase
MMFRPEIEEILDDLKRRLQALYGVRLVDVVVFGSVARGEDTAESDVDVLLVLRDPVDRYAESGPLADLMVAMMARHHVFVTPVVFSEEAYRTANWPLLRNVREEGISL